MTPVIAGYYTYESNLAARQPQGATSVIQAITGDGLAQGPYVAAIGGVEPTTFHTEGTDILHVTNHVPLRVKIVINLKSMSVKMLIIPLTSDEPLGTADLTLESVTTSLSFFSTQSVFTITRFSAMSLLHLLGSTSTSSSSGSGPAAAAAAAAG